MRPLLISLLALMLTQVPLWPDDARQVCPKVSITVLRGAPRRCQVEVIQAASQALNRQLFRLQLRVCAGSLS